MNDRLLREPVHHRRAALGAGILSLALAATLAGCANPSFIGVQDYGTIMGNVVDTAGKPINGALVSATGTSSTFRSNADGSFSLPKVAIGTQTLTISAPGYALPATPISVVVAKDVAVSAGNVALSSTTVIPH